MKPLLVVDAANVVGSVPDGWWRDRAGAAERLRDALQGRDEEVVLVVEGKARNVSSIPDVRVVSAPGDGDDTIVEVVRTEGADRQVTVVTADRELRARVVALGADVAGPTSVPRR
ncbi:NTP pyrophosphohydrolase [Lentzea sp. NPDC058450]|uniref:NTP pyrophosphohydrolase n=1 Tax=Lentzea sp. NPDC058450 TaxID=3346505 RepID=UPI003650C7B9